MSWVTAKPGENIESLLKRFKKAVDKSGVLSDLKKHEFYEKPSVKRKRKQAAARKRALKKAKKLARQAARKRSNQNFRWNKDHTKKIPLTTKKKAPYKKNTTNSQQQQQNIKPNYNSNSKNHGLTKRPTLKKAKRK